MATPDPAAPKTTGQRAVRAHHGVPAERLLPEPGLPAIPLRRRGEEGPRREAEPRGRRIQTKDGHRRVKDGCFAQGRSGSSSRRRSARGSTTRARRRPARDQHPGLARAQRVLRRGAAGARSPLRSRHVGCGLHRRPREVPESRRGPSGRAGEVLRGRERSHLSRPRRLDLRLPAALDRASNRKQPKFKQSRLEQLLDILVAGTDEQVEQLADALGEPKRPKGRSRKPSPRSPATRSRTPRPSCPPSTSP